MKYVRVKTNVVPNKTRDVTEAEVIFLIGEDQFKEILEEAKSSKCGVLVEVNPTHYGTSSDWIGIEW